MRRRSLMSNGDKPIEFADAEVKRICVESFGGKDGGTAATSDRVGGKKVKGKAGEITYKQAASVKIIRTQFRANSLITSFNELEYFINVEQIGVTGNSGGAFYNCVNLTFITLPSNVKYLYGDGTFRLCKKITSLYIPDSVIQTGSGTFAEMSTLVSVRVSKNMNLYKSDMFFDDKLLETITNATPPTGVSYRGFSFCKKLDLSFIDYSILTYVGASGFRQCQSSTVPSAVILASLTSHDTFPFWETNVRKLYYPVLSMTNVGTSTFNNYGQMTLYDFGKNIKGSARFDTNATVVFRGDNYSELSFIEVMPKKVYVPSLILDDFKTQHSNVESKTYAIGGTEWITQFGSSDEWADYPNGVNPYANASS